MGRSDGRRRGLSAAAYGEISMAAVTHLARSEIERVFTLRMNKPGACFGSR